MILIVRIFCILVLLMATGCTKNEFYLEFDLATDVTANYKVVYYASNSKGGMMVESVATVSEGKGSLRCVTYNPVLLYLYSGQSEPVVIYARRGQKIPIQGSGKNPVQWEIGGNDINEELSKWRHAYETQLASGNRTEMDKAVAEFVSRNPDSEIAPLLLLTGFSRHDNEPLFRTLWRSLRTPTSAPDWLTMVGRSDIQNQRVMTPATLKSMTMRSLHNGVDTIRPASAKATALFFWQNGIDSRRTLIDSVKAMTKEWPDSARRIIADVSLDADSISWKSPLRSDSLHDVARLWAPSGLADPALRDLNVCRVPFYIILNPEGQQVYRGDDLPEAIAAFRRLLSTQ